MKKLFATILTLCLLCGASALAADAGGTSLTGNGSGNTTVKYSVTRNTDFIVTIPAEASLTAGTGDAEAKGTLDFSIAAEKINVPGFRIVVALAGDNDFKLKLSDSTEGVAYTVKNADNTQEYNAGDSVLTWTYNTSAPEITGTQTLNLSATAADFKEAGEYTDTLTFTVTTGELS